MILRFLLVAGLVGFSFSARAVQCALAKDSETQSAWETWRVDVDGGARVTLVDVVQARMDVRKEIAALLSNETYSYRDLKFRAEKILSENPEALSEHAAALRDLNARLEKRQLNYVIVDLPPENLPAWEQFTSRLYLNAFYLQVMNDPKDVSLDRLILLDAGVPFYLKTVEPERFANVRFEGIRLNDSKPSDDAETSPRAEEKPSRRKGPDPERAFERLKERLHGSRRSLRQAYSMRAKLHSRAYAKMSADEIKEKILPRFWRPARSAVRQWLDAEIAARNQKAAPSKRERERENREHERDRERHEPSVVRDLLGRKGEGILYLRHEKFEKLRREFADVCE